MPLALLFSLCSEQTNCNQALPVQLGPSCQGRPFCYQLPPKPVWRGGAITLGTFAEDLECF